MKTLKDYAVDTNKLTLQEFLDRYKYQNNFAVYAYQTGDFYGEKTSFSFECNGIHYMKLDPHTLVFESCEPRRTWQRFLKQLLMFLMPMETSILANLVKRLISAPAMIC